MQLCMDIVIDKERKYPTTLKIYAFEAFNNIISLRVARMEFIDTNRVPEQGELRDAAVEAYLNQRLSIFNK